MGKVVPEMYNSFRLMAEDKSFVGEDQSIMWKLKTCGLPSTTQDANENELERVGY